MHEGWKQILAFNLWLPKAGDVLSRFLGGKGQDSGYHPGDGSLVPRSSFLVRVVKL